MEHVLDAIEQERREVTTQRAELDRREAFLDRMTAAASAQPEAPEPETVVVRHAGHVAPEGKRTMRAGHADDLIHAHLRQHGPQTISQLIMLLGIAREEVRDSLARQRGKGRVERSGIEWRAIVPHEGRAETTPYVAPTPEAIKETTGEREERVYAFIEEHPGCAAADIRAAIEVGLGQLKGSLMSLRKHKRVEVSGAHKGTRYWTKEAHDAL